MAPRIGYYKILAAKRSADNKFITSDADSFLTNNIWVPIVGCALGLILLIVIIYCIWRCRYNNRYDYSVLKADLQLPQKLEMERKLQRDTMRETALLHCQYYIRSSGLYVFIEHLPEIGSRVGKHWFVVRDIRSKTEKFLTMLPRGAQMLLPFSVTTRRTLADLLLSLQHPYLYPIYDLDMLIEQDRVVVVSPFNSKGSLKDLIYHSHCTDCWENKYRILGTGLSVKQLSLYGRQILEALVYLRRCGLPPMAHLHSGNIIVENNTCRLTGFENQFLGLTPKMYGLATRRLKADKVSIDTICFGHLLYEMTMGAELDSTIPMLHHLVAVEEVSVREVLEFIFTDSGDGFPSLEQIAEHNFFRSVTLRELQVFKPVPVKFTKNMKAILKSMKKGHLYGQMKGRKDETKNVSRESRRTKGARNSPDVVDSETGPTARVQESPKPLPPGPRVAGGPALQTPIRPLAPPPRHTPTPPVQRPDVGERTALLSEIKRGAKLKPVGQGNPRV